MNQVSTNPAPSADTGEVKRLREALEAWEHWYSVDSTEFNRDTAREMGLRALNAGTKNA